VLAQAAYCKTSLSGGELVRWLVTDLTAKPLPFIVLLYFCGFTLQYAE